MRMPSESSTLHASEWQREAEQGTNMDCDGVNINSNCNNGGMQVDCTFVNPAFLEDGDTRVGVRIMCIHSRIYKYGFLNMNPLPLKMFIFPQLAK